MGASLRASAALAAGGLALHQLRYLAGHGGEAGSALAREGHGYLGLVVPVVAILCAVALAHLVLSLQRRVAPGRRRSLRRLWPLAATSLLAIYLAQELLEGAILAGHPSGLAGLAGAGGWVAVPLALALGLAIALLLRGANALLGARASRSLAFSPPRDARRPALRDAPVPSAVLGRHLAGRAPPPISF